MADGREGKGAGDPGGEGGHGGDAPGRGGPDAGRRAGGADPGEGERPPRSPEAAPDRRLWLDPNLRIVYGVTLMAVLGVSSVTPAFPRIVDALGISGREIGLLITVFTLPGVVLTPVLGVMADRYGRKRILVPSLLLFAVAGASCALARDFGLLLGLRFLQGVGAASLGSLNATLIGDLFSGRERTAAMGYNASVLSVGTASYPAIGGAMAMAGWHWPFALPAVGVGVALLVLLRLENPEPDAEEGLGEYLRKAWSEMRDRRVAGLFAASAATFVILYGAYLTYLPLHMARAFDASSLVIGLYMSGMSLSTAVTSARLGWLTERVPEATLLRISYLLYAAGLVGFALAPGLEALAVPIVLFGVGHGLNVPNILTLLAGLAPLESRGAFMSLNGMVLRLGQTLGPVVMGAIFAVRGVGATFYAGAALAVAMVAVVLRLVEGDRGREG